MKNFKQKLYDRIYNYLIEDTESFALITKKLVKNPSVFPMIYLGMVDSSKINLPTGVQADTTNFEIYILTNNPPEDYAKGGNEILLDLTSEVEYALAKPVNWSTNHLGFKGIVKDAYFTDEAFYDDESSAGGNIAAVLSFTVVHVGSTILKDIRPEK